MTKPAQFFYGSVPRTALATSISPSDVTITVTDPTGWPTVGPFVIILERGTAREERVKIASRTGPDLTVAASGRGYDASTAVGHTQGAATYVEHGIDAAWHQAVDAILAKTTTKGDLLVSTGAAYARQPAGTNGLPLQADSAQANGIKYATLDTVGITDGAVTAVKIASGAITSAKLGTDSVGSAAIAAGVVGTSELADLSVTVNKLAAGAIADPLKFASPIAPIQSVFLADPSSGMVEGSLIARTDLDCYKVASSTTAVVRMGIWGNWGTGGRPGAQVSQTTGQTLTTAVTASVQAQAVDFDGLSMATGGNSTTPFTVPAGMTGYWLLLHRAWLGAAGISNGEMSWYTNLSGSAGVAFGAGASSTANISAGFFPNFTASAICFLNAGDVITIQVQQTSGSNKTLKGVWTMIWCGP